ncbi:DNA-binding GntR family transcriptional regulator [Saccharopolyspora erythraea NRRL 2338]|uniref:Transcriptional regulator, GntR family n=2 Tax=Saccharopolyspora erythraea TaxID=1836 RepID=A4FAZ5_SACEN|nr:GntR family transcriptional regulator [Saccharopolyspora erythraea]EQD87601.1 GntR family transcriptional regulator [Saccharopolyspora erythraea D]PFG95004.1 DNA-binding GntR family transcriptional regulator [Saccharopolyspora erythraea NRRL 2338]QRK91693.1 GntR family transcriptional regulator [Saccharopolyspora erythraea]CAM01220.1 transcriptional regulator, GntR family [Saccharopolyspora erythraea NRRL 2338]
MRRPPTTQEFVLDELRKSIVAGELAPGQPIRQDAIAQHLGVSRVPLREALKTLEAEGQVVYQPHRGYSVAELSLDDLLEVYRMRELLESEAATVAAGRFDESDLAVITEAQREVESASRDGDLVGMIAANRRFHFALLEPARMPRLLRVVRTLWDATDAYRAVYYNSDANRARVHEEHAAIVDAAKRHDAAELVVLLTEHRDHAVETLRATIPADAAKRD